MFGSAPCEEREHTFDLLEVKEGEKLLLCCLSETLEGVYTHYVSKTVLCTGAGCSLCEFGRTPRYLGFLVVMYKSRRRLLRLTASSAFRLLASPPVPGHVFEATRRFRRSPLILTFQSTVTVNPNAVVNKIEMLNVLSHLFGLGGLDFSLSYDDCLEFLRDRAKLVAKRSYLPLDA